MNDANLVELARLSGARVALRDDQLSVSGPADAVDRAVAVAQRMIELARQREPVTPDDVMRLHECGSAAPSNGCGERENGLRIALPCPGCARSSHPRRQGRRSTWRKIVNTDIVVGIGPAGTGKTYLAVAAGVDALVRKRVRRIVLARPAVEAGESLGFLPGDMQAKVDPYLRPLYDALDAMMPPERIQRALETRTIEIAPLAFMRGRTLADAFVILDEAQNATTLQMKMFLTRLGVNSKIVITGDKTQIDLPRREESGLMQIERISAWNRWDRLPLF